MIDGIDGLAGSLIIIACIGMLSSSINIANFLFTPILLALISGLIPFLFFNIIGYKKNKVFLGDGGSLFLGFIVSLGLIYNAENVNNFSPSFSLWCVAFPIFDFLAVIILRKIENRSLIIASKDHVHHLLRDYGLSNNIILIIAIFVSLGLLLIGYLLERNFPLASFPAFIFSFCFYLFIIFSLRLKKQ